jgi:hypothetical protein
VVVESRMLVFRTNAWRNYFPIRSTTIFPGNDRA